MLSKLFLWVRKRERHLSAFAMLAGFLSDNLLFVRVDLIQTQVLFAVYTVLCFISIPLFHWLEIHQYQNRLSTSARTVLPFVIQFVLGGFWSGFVIFYGRSADLGASWPFLLLLSLTLLANEYFHQYHDRLVFTSILFFLALYSYAIFAVPLYTGTIGTGTFLESGAVAVGLFALFTILLRSLARERFLLDIWRIRIGALVVLVFMNLFYFTNVIPPLPLSVHSAGVYYAVWRVPGAYLAMSEPASWQTRLLGFSPVLHVSLGEPVSAYSSVFAPIAFATTIVHRWEWFDPVQKLWVVKSTIAYPIVGGRDGGYRGYSTVPMTVAGDWRVIVETVDGRRITELPFRIESTTSPRIETIVTLK